MKKVISWTILMLGMSGAALAAARLDKDATITELLLDIPFWLSMAVVILAVLLNQKGRKKAIQQSDGEKSVSVQISTWLDEIDARLKQLNSGESLEERAANLASLQEDVVFSVTESKNRLISAKGFSFYARFMSEFAVAERFLARAWSAAVDGYLEESNTYLDKAQDFFKQSKNQLRSHQ